MLRISTKLDGRSLLQLTQSPRASVAPTEEVIKEQVKRLEKRDSL